MFSWFFLGFLGAIGVFYAIEMDEQNSSNGTPILGKDFNYKDLTLGKISITMLFISFISLFGYVAVLLGAVFATVSFLQHSGLGKKIYNYKPFSK